MVFTSIKRPAFYLSKLTDYFEQIVREMSRALFYHILTNDAKRPKKLVNEVPSVRVRTMHGMEILLSLYSILLYRGNKIMFTAFPIQFILYLC